MATSAELRMDQLPSDPLLHILAFLGFRDVIKYVADTANYTLPVRGRKVTGNKGRLQENVSKESRGDAAVLRAKCWANKRIITTPEQRCKRTPSPSRCAISNSMLSRNKCTRSRPRRNVIF